MVKISAEDLLQVISDPSFEENIAQLISQNPDLEQSFDLAIMRIKSKMPLFKNPKYERSLTEDEVLKLCADRGINMSRKNFKGNYLEKEMARYNAAYFHEDAWEFDYVYISCWVPLLLADKYELRHKIVLLMQEIMESTISDTDEVKECKDSQEDNDVNEHNISETHFQIIPGKNLKYRAIFFTLFQIVKILFQIISAKFPKKKPLKRGFNGDIILYFNPNLVNFVEMKHKDCTIIQCYEPI